MELEYDTEAARAAGVILEEDVYEDYYGFNDTRQFLLPDKKQYIEYKIMTEGDRAKYQKATSSDITLMRNTDEARMKVDPATARHELLKNSVCGWKIMRRNGQGKFQPVTFSIGSPGAEFEKWLNQANPRIVEDLEKDIRKANPWLMDEMTLEQIDKEIANLQEMREVKVASDLEKESSSDK